jgi:hypothetical protein
MKIEKVDVELRMADAVQKVPGLAFYPGDRDAVAKRATDEAWRHIESGPYTMPDLILADPRNFIRSAITALGLDEKVRARGGY